MRTAGNWKFIAGAASFAVVVSVIASAIRGVPFGTVLLRAIAGGVSFAVLSFAIVALISRFFPELKEAFSAPSAKEKPAALEGVDITLDGENPHEEAGTAAEAESEAVRELRETADGEVEMFAGSGNAVDSELEEENGQSGEADADSMFAVEVEDITGENDEATDDVDEVEPVDDIDEEGAGDTGGDTASPRFDGLDTLGEEMDGPVITDRSKVDLMGAEEEPEDIARAVRTLMNRDQEG